MLLSCSAAADPAPARPPAEGVMLLNLQTGQVVAQRELGDDPLAVAVSGDGKTAYVADNDLGDVFALRLPSLRQEWRRHVGGAPGPMLLAGGELYVSEYDAGAAAELDPATGRQLATLPLGPHPGELALVGGRIASARGAGFGLAVADGGVWNDARLPKLPGLKPFWLEAGKRGELLVTEEGSPEDTAAGAVLALDTATGDVSTIATPRDPDAAVRSGPNVYVAAHGDDEVLVLGYSRPRHWARGAEAVALAVDSQLGLLVVVTDAAE
jgi:DNA-binding beta-propeller fold protein YncE